jgi:hypothetical protein
LVLVFFRLWNWLVWWWSREESTLEIGEKRKFQESLVGRRKEQKKTAEGERRGQISEKLPSGIVSWDGNRPLQNMGRAETQAGTAGTRALGLTTTM